MSQGFWKKQKLDTFFLTLFNFYKKEVAPTSVFTCSLIHITRLVADIMLVGALTGVIYTQIRVQNYLMKSPDR